MVHSGTISWGELRNMLTFQTPTIEDRAWLQPLLRAANIPLCSYSFSTLICWQSVYGQEVARLGERVIIRARNSEGMVYLWPCGTGELAPALLAMEADAAEQGLPFQLVGVTEALLPALQEVFPGRVTVLERRDNYDYQYEVDRLAELPGKKLHAKRNQIRPVYDRCPEAKFLPLTEADVEDCLALDRLWYEEHRERAEDAETIRSLDQERGAMELAVRNCAALGMDGGVIRCGGEVLAYTLGTLLHETVYDVQFERAKADFQGAFPVINREFARFIRDKYPTVAYIDREEDLGNPGLRKAKLSYGVDRLMENLCVVIEKESGKGG